MKLKFLALAAAMLLSIPAFGQAVSSGKVTTAAPTYANGTAGALSLDTAGNLRVLAAASGTGAFNLTQIKGVAVSNTIPGTLDITCVSGCVAGSGVAQATATAVQPTYVEGTNNPLSMTLNGALRIGGSVGLSAGTNNIGDVDVLTLPSIPAGTNNIGDVDVLTLPSIPAGTNNIGDVDVLFGASATPGDGVSNTSIAVGVLDSTGTARTSIRVLPYIYNGSTWDRVRSDTNILGSQLVVDTPSASTTAGIASTATTAVGSSLVLKASAGNLYSATITAGATDGYGMLFNATSAPADGAVTPANCWVVPANSTVGISYDVPYAAATGITVVFSSTGCFTKTASATAFISGQVK